ncbi:MAG: SDR family oxidoreductase [bacterium]|nr:SDR family oxidoreductase [bacterium]
MLQAHNQARRISFQITESMVRRFAFLTGDSNPLHLHEDAAATSAYRERIVHGFLPLCFLLAVQFPRISGTWRLRSLQAKFLKPVFLDDALTLEVHMQEQSGFSWRILNHKSQESLIEGKGEIEPSEARIPIASDTPEEGLLKDDVQERTYAMQEIQEGMANTMRFAVSQGAIVGLQLLLQEGLPDEKFSPAFSPLELLALLMCSPSVGMVMPGTSATLYGFEVTIHEPVVLNAPYEFKEEVTFVSGATHSIKKEFTVGSAIRGFITAGVRSPRVHLSSFADIQKKAHDMGLKDKVVLITGANSGIGATCAMLFAALGARVAINYLRGKEDAENLSEDIRKGGGKALCFQADITNREQVRAMVEKINESFGAVDVLVNNAVRDFLPKDFLSTQWEDIQRDLDVVVKGSVHCSQEVIPGMIKAGGGRIITIGTVATDDPPSRHSKYVIAKSGLVGLTRALAVEYARQNIFVNMVVPSMVETDLIAHIPDGFRKKIAEESPLGRYAEPLDVARAVVFLASDYASFTTGQKIMVTGGLAPFL